MAGESSRAPLTHLNERLALTEIGAYFHSRGWSVGTSSNYSIVVEREPTRLLVTASGADKGRLSPEEFVVVDGDGERVDASDPGPSAETLLHVLIARDVGVGAILHTHSVWGTILGDRVFRASRRHGSDGNPGPLASITSAPTAACLEIEGYEMLKGLAGVKTHEHTERVPIFENSQDMRALASEIAAWLEAERAAHGFLLRKHGLYTWGRDLEEARRQVEIFEFLFEVLGRGE